MASRTLFLRYWAILSGAKKGSPGGVSQNGSPFTSKTAPGNSLSAGKSTNNSGSGQENAQFSLIDNLKPVFYSNAERAVEGLKQEKATPEQWKAMLQKVAA